MGGFLPVLSSYSPVGHQLSDIPCGLLPEPLSVSGFCHCPRPLALIITYKVCGQVNDGVEFRIRAV